MRRAASLIVLGGLLGCGGQPQGDGAPDFARDVQPVLRESCLSCHSAAKKRGGLRLDSRAAAMKGGFAGPVIVPGRSAESRLLELLLSGDMPQKAAPLSREKIELIRQWIDAGAPWPESTAASDTHWAFVKPARRDPPGGASHPIDAFVLARLKKEGLALSPEAPRDKLLRRLALDLTGLPPSPGELDGTYEEAVDRLLASPHFGEHWARPWLDLARYADTDGYEKDLRRTMWTYRDWVIDAFNRDMPFTQFTVEQIAGDLLPGATRDQLIATGFHRNTLFNNEGGVDQDEARYHVLVDRVNTTATVWLGATLACAQCHNHKYDPYSQKEYFRLYAFFTGTAYDKVGPAHIGEMRYVEPQIEAATREQEARRTSLRAEIARLEGVLVTPTPELAVAQAEWEKSLPPEPWTVLKPEGAKSSAGATLTVLDDGSVLASGDSPDRDTYTLTVRTDDFTMLRLEALPHESKGPGRAENGNFVLTAFRVKDARVTASGAEHSQGGHAPGSEAGWAILPRTGQVNAAYFAVDAPAGEATIELEFNSPFERHTLGRFRLAATTEPVDAGARGTPWSDPAADASTWATMDLPRHWDGSLDGAVWFRRDVEVPADGEATLELGPIDDNDVTWVNGVKVGATDGWTIPRAYRFEAKRGRATIVVRAVDTGGPGGFHGKPEQMRLRVGEASIPLAGAWAYSIGLDVRAPQRGRTPTAVLAILETKERSDAQSAELAAYYRSIAPSLDAPRRELTTTRAKLDALQREIPTALIMREQPDAKLEAPIRIRGSFVDRGEIVTPGVPDVLHTMSAERPTRLDLARWLVSEENPVVARLTVNRIWQHIFGRGLVETSEDFGTQGARPTHPELLDWLATEFVRGGWRHKPLIRLIVTSATYRQASAATRAAYERDPFNRLLARGPRFRLDAESIRDVALAVSGLLSRKVGGPSVFPHQPDGIWRMPFNADQWMPSAGEDAHRRGLYTFLRRTAPYPSFMTFDATSREHCAGRRVRTNTPLQALTLLNDPVFVEAAKALARRVASETVPEAAAFRLATGRAPTERELARLVALGDLELAASVILNLDEVQTKE